MKFFREREHDGTILYNVYGDDGEYLGYIERTYKLTRLGYSPDGFEAYGKKAERLFRSHTLKDAQEEFERIAEVKK